MPAGVAPAGSGVEELASSVRLPPLTANAPTAPILLSSTNRVWPSGAEAGVDRADAAGGADRCAAEQGQRPAGGDRVAGDGAGAGVHGGSARHGDLHPARSGLQIGEGEDPTGDSVPSAESRNAETVPELAPALWALDTNS